MKKKVLITGATGLVGASLTKKLLQAGNYEIYIAGRNIKPEWGTGNIHFIETDFAKDWDVDTLPAAVDAVIHLSQSEDFRHFPEKATNIFNINTLSTLKLINYAFAKKAKHFIYASSGGVYGNGARAFKEEDPVVYKKESGFYIGSKHCSEVILQNYSGLLNVVILRFFFVYGKEQKKDMLIPRLVNFIKNGDPITLQGTEGISINPIYVDDAVNAVIASLQLTESNIINVAGTETFSLKQIGSIIGNAAGKAPGFIIDETKEPASLTGNISKMKQLLITPQTTFAAAVKTLI